mmetsp:Transcript_11516/g.21121  ORF Transcript_11516/g.21121 Transcript_11516/m.21121 type:complete len:125 (-) Transcript_11516:200-574(-)|eukprot:CAMPEP_0197515658 /NCGR_PEP_ID=MMETSP1318-20131121/722_1 /TAXON_ID=552666 /ORGANISM="Partenskyella glossopodia, Strain RCC365" /LENGTH=124 /DNA_ID=CAMNT_0043064085 /DNA_START=68 /DNA_END=442 /DNA_ORIENTATION=-
MSEELKATYLKNPEKLVDAIKAPQPMDLRFISSQNQAKNCWTAYNEMLKCMKENGDDSAKCTVYSKAAFTMCPRDWLAAWKEARQLREVSDGHGGTKTVHNFYGVDHGTLDTGDDEEDDDDDDE